MSDMTMVEKVRKAIDGAYTEAMALNIPADEAESRAARAAIEAMREPTEAMVNADFMYSTDPIFAEVTWKAMIDAALTPTKDR